MMYIGIKLFLSLVMKMYYTLSADIDMYSCNTGCTKYTLVLFMMMYSYFTYFKYYYYPDYFPVADTSQLLIVIEDGYCTVWISYNQMWHCEWRVAIYWMKVSHGSGFPETKVKIWFQFHCKENTFWGTSIIFALFSWNISWYM